MLPKQTRYREPWQTRQSQDGFVDIGHIFFSPLSAIAGFDWFVDIDSGTSGLLSATKSQKVPAHGRTWTHKYLTVYCRCAREKSVLGLERPGCNLVPSRSRDPSLYTTKTQIHLLVFKEKPRFSSLSPQVPKKSFPPRNRDEICTMATSTSVMTTENEAKQVREPLDTQHSVPKRHRPRLTEIARSAP